MLLLAGQEVHNPPLDALLHLQLFAMCCTQLGITAIEDHNQKQTEVLGASAAETLEYYYGFRRGF